MSVVASLIASSREPPPPPGHTLVAIRQRLRDTQTKLRSLRHSGQIVRAVACVLWAAVGWSAQEPIRQKGGPPPIEQIPSFS